MRKARFVLRYTMKLIGSSASPYVRKVRIVLAEKKIDYKFVLEDVWAESTSIHSSNPLGKVPCLVMDDDGALFDSRVIVEYLDTLTPLGKLIPQSGRERAEVRCWEALADGISDAAVTIRVEHTQRELAQQNQAWIQRHLRKITLGLRAMAQGLGERSWCYGTHMTLADIATGCALGYLDFRFPEIEWRSEYDNLAKLFDKLSTRPSFIDTLPNA